MNKTLLRPIIALGLASLILLSGCSSFERKAFDPQQKERIEVISVLEPNADPEFNVRMLSHPGQNFGLIGALVAESAMSSSQSKFHEAIAHIEYDYAEHFTQSLLTELEAMGYQPVLTEIERETRNGKVQRNQFHEDYKTLTIDGDDALLDVYVSYSGYLAAGATTDYRPTVHVAARLVDSQNQETLFSDQIHINPGHEDESVLVDAPADFRFENIKALEADPDSAIEGIKQAVELAARTVANQLG